ncbi:glycoside hydrolase family 43 protein [Lacrimispora sp.]|uniref:glycoside hydrolase family 43 protein n=1 Tax=Lacrimispora sp. TaxID=2719234 RepID=UPI00399538E1
MKQAYLFVHFKEKETPDGEQVYFALSQDGFHWEEVNGGKPILTSTIGEQGVRDFTICRTEEGIYYILATDLSLARNFKTKYKGSWKEVSRNGSKTLVLWQSEDLVHFLSPRMIRFGDEPFGCVWAPDIIKDKKQGDYLIHWSSSHPSNDYGPKKIYYARTRDFEHFSKPAVLYEKEGSDIIDSAMYEENGRYYLFVKCEQNPATILLLESGSITGPFSPVPAFLEEMAKLEQGQYEAPTAFQTEDGRWCLFLDYYGTVKEKQGYVPFISDRLSTGRFVRSDEAFSFPYGFKHGTVLTLTEAEYERLKNTDF